MNGEGTEKKNAWNREAKMEKDKKGKSAHILASLWQTNVAA